MCVVHGAGAWCVRSSEIDFWFRASGKCAASAHSMSMKWEVGSLEGGSTKYEV